MGTGAVREHGDVLCDGTGCSHHLPRRRVERLLSKPFRNFFLVSNKKSERKRVFIVIPYGAWCFLLSFLYIYLYIYIYRLVRNGGCTRVSVFQKPYFQILFFSTSSASIKFCFCKNNKRIIITGAHPVLWGECCLLVLNLVSSTLPCIRQPRPRLYFVVLIAE